MKNGTDDRTLQQIAMGAGFDSLGALAQAAKVSRRIVYHANIGIPPSAEAAKKIIRAVSRRAPSFDAKALVAALHEGLRRNTDRLSEALR